MDTISEWFRRIFASNEFMPHGHCYLWKPELLWMHVVSDALIGVAYVFIAVTLYLLVRKIRIPFSPMILAFGMFIFACGLTHFMEVWTAWTPTYWLAGGVKVVTALASVATGLFLIPVRPQVVMHAAEAAVSEARRVALEEKTTELEALTVQLRQLALDQIRVSEERFRSLVLSTAQVVWLGAPDGSFSEPSATWLSFTGQTAEAARGWGWLDAVHPDDREQLLAIWRTAITAKSHYESESRLRLADGTYAFLLWRATPLLNSDGTIREWVGAGSDITVRKALEAERERLLSEAQANVHVRDEFLAIAAHELRTPLTALFLQVESMERVRAEPATVDRRIAMVKRQVQRLTTLNERLLDVSKVQAGSLEVRPVETDLVAAVKETLKSLGPEFERSRCTLELRTDPKVSALVDPERIDQVLTNLLINAMKFGAGQAIDVEVRQEGQTATLIVKDRGIGISEDAQARLFRKFERAVPSENYGGLGLGLYISRVIVEKLGGTISLKSAAGEGATFTVALPATAQAEAPSSG